MKTLYDIGDEIEIKLRGVVKEYRGSGIRIRSNLKAPI